MTSEVTQAVLDPCPFCGGEAEEANSKGPTGERYRWVQCADCGAMTECCDDSARHNNPDEPEPVDLWNTRLTAQSGEGRSGAGEDAVEAAAKAIAMARYANHNPPVRWPADENDCLSGRDGTVPLSWDYAEECRASARAALRATNDAGGA